MINQKHHDMIKKIILKIYCKSLIIVHHAGCHQRADRSFFYKEYQFPMCARCTGVFLGYLLAIPMYFIYPFDFGLYIALCMITFFDWYIQYRKIKESTNPRRLITGIIGGFGVMSMQIVVMKHIIIAICRLIQN